MTRWNQCRLVSGAVELVTWVRNAVLGETIDEWTVAAVYAPVIGTCAECKGRTAFPGSKKCLRCNVT